MEQEEDDDFTSVDNIEVDDVRTNVAELSEVIPVIETNDTVRETAEDNVEEAEWENSDDEIDQAAQEQAKREMQERLSKIPPSYVLTQELMRCTPSQKKQFKSDS